MLPWLRERVAARVGGRDSTAEATRRPAPVRLHRAGDAGPGRGGRLGRPRRRLQADRRPGRVATPSAPASPIARSAGSSTTHAPSPSARSGAAVDTPASSSTRRATGTVRAPAPGASRTTCPRSSPRPVACSRPSGFVLLTAHTRVSRTTGSRTRSAVRCGDRQRPIEAGAARAGDRGRTDASTSARSRGRPAGHDVVDALPHSAAPDELRQPRVKAAAALRDRRERDRAGLTLVDGAREVRRALDAGVEVVEAFVCEPLLAGPDARAALDLLRDRGVADPGDERGGLRQARLRRARRGSPGRGPHPVARTSPTSRSPTIRWSPSSRASRSPATSARSCAAPTARAWTPSSPPRRGPTCSTRTRSGPAPARSSPSRLAAAPTADVLAWLRERGLRIVAARVDAGASVHRGRPDRPARDRPRGRGRRPDRTPGPPTASKPSACRCSASPTASTSRSAPPSCSTRRAASVASRPHGQEVTVDTLRLRDHRRRDRPARPRRTRRASSARRSRSSTGAGSAAAARTSAACRRSRSSTAPPGTTRTRPAYDWPARLGPPRLHGQPARRCRRARRFEPRRRRCTRRAPSSTAGSGAITGRGRVAVQPRRRRPTS